MSDLISRSATIQRFIQEIEDSGSNVMHINTIKRVLQDIETDYDVDAVVKGIREYAECNDECAKIFYEGMGCKACFFNTMMDLVRKGGVNE